VTTNQIYNVYLLYTECPAVDMYRKFGSTEEIIRQRNTDQYRVTYDLKKSLNVSHSIRCNVREILWN